MTTLTILVACLLRTLAAFLATLATFLAFLAAFLALTTTAFLAFFDDNLGGFLGFGDLFGDLGFDSDNLLGDLLDDFFDSGDLLGDLLFDNLSGLFDDLDDLFQDGAFGGFFDSGDDSLGLLGNGFDAH